jgi:Tol biopolymer transport system component
VTSGSQVIEVLDVSPDGRWLVFDSNRRMKQDLYRIPVGGGDEVPLTNSLPGNEAGPRWSPDGKEIAFTASTPGSPGSSQIMVMSAEGGPPAALTNSPSASMFPDWSPSGFQLAFITASRSGQWPLWILSRDSVGGPWRGAVLHLDLTCNTPEWAPDGSGVLCVPRLTELVLVSPDGRVIRRRDLAATGGVTMAPTAPRYSRDGRTIYVTGTHEDGRRGVWAIPAAGGTPRLVLAFDDPLLDAAGSLGVGPDHLYLSVSQYESDIWVAKLRW